MNSDQKDAIIQTISHELGLKSSEIPKTMSDSLVFHGKISGSAIEIIRKIAEVARLSETAQLSDGEIQNLIGSPPNSNGSVICYTSPFNFFFYNKSSGKLSDSPTPSEFSGYMNKAIMKLMEDIEDLTDDIESVESERKAKRKEELKTKALQKFKKIVEALPKIIQKTNKDGSGKPAYGSATGSKRGGASSSGANQMEANGEPVKWQKRPQNVVVNKGIGGGKGGLAGVKGGISGGLGGGTAAAIPNANTTMEEEALKRERREIEKLNNNLEKLTKTEQLEKQQRRVNTGAGGREYEKEMLEFNTDFLNKRMARDKVERQLLSYPEELEAEIEANKLRAKTGHNAAYVNYTRSDIQKLGIQDAHTNINDRAKYIANEKNKEQLAQSEDSLLQTRRKWEHDVRNDYDAKEKANIIKHLTQEVAHENEKKLINSEKYDLQNKIDKAVLKGRKPDQEVFVQLNNLAKEALQAKNGSLELDMRNKELNAASKYQNADMKARRDKDLSSIHNEKAMHEAQQDLIRSKARGTTGAKEAADIAAETTLQGLKKQLESLHLNRGIADAEEISKEKGSDFYKQKAALDQEIGLVEAQIRKISASHRVSQTDTEHLLKSMELNHEAETFHDKKKQASTKGALENQRLQQEFSIAQKTEKSVIELAEHQASIKSLEAELKREDLESRRGLATSAAIAEQKSIVADLEAKIEAEQQKEIDRQQRESDIALSITKRHIGSHFNKYDRKLGDLSDLAEAAERAGNSKYDEIGKLMENLDNRIHPNVWYPDMAKALLGQIQDAINRTRSITEDLIDSVGTELENYYESSPSANTLSEVVRVLDRRMKSVIAIMTDPVEKVDIETLSAKEWYEGALKEVDEAMTEEFNNEEVAYIMKQVKNTIDMELKFSMREASQLNFLDVQAEYRKLEDMNEIRESTEDSFKSLLRDEVQIGLSLKRAYQDIWKSKVQRAKIKSDRHHLTKAKDTAADSMDQLDMINEVSKNKDAGGNLKKLLGELISEKPPEDEKGEILLTKNIVRLMEGGYLTNGDAKSDEALKAKLVEYEKKKKVAKEGIFNIEKDRADKLVTEKEEKAAREARKQKLMSGVVINSNTNEDIVNEIKEKGKALLQGIYAAPELKVNLPAGIILMMAIEKGSSRAYEILLQTDVFGAPKIFEPWDAGRVVYTKLLCNQISNYKPESEGEAVDMREFNAKYKITQDVIKASIKKLLSPAVAGFGAREFADTDPDGWIGFYLNTELTPAQQIKGLVTYRGLSNSEKAKEVIDKYVLELRGKKPS